MRVYIEHPNHQYKDLFESLGFTVVSDVGSANLVCFTGGEDVTPDMYGDKKHPYTGNNVHRDEREKRLFEHCLASNLPMVGICRGGQFLNVMSGGRMYQHITGHGGDHELTDLFTGEVVRVSSTHHQMMMPSAEGTLIATSTTLLSNREWYDHQIFRKDTSKEGVEVVYYAHTKCLSFQPHPEFPGEQYEAMRRWFNGLLGRYLNVVATPVACVC